MRSEDVYEYIYRFTIQFSHSQLFLHIIYIDGKHFNIFYLFYIQFSVVFSSAILLLLLYLYSCYYNNEYHRNIHSRKFCIKCRKVKILTLCDVNIKCVFYKRKKFFRRLMTDNFSRYYMEIFPGNEYFHPHYIYISLLTKIIVINFYFFILTNKQKLKFNFRVIDQNLDNQLFF